MHTAICAFDDRSAADTAVDSLVRAGFSRQDVHVEHKHLHGEKAEANDRWDGMEREIALDRGVLSSFGHFFASLFGQDNPSGHVGTYAQHVERGSYVVVVDTRDAAEAERARTMLHGLQAGDLNVVQRSEQRPLRDIVGMRQEGSGMAERSREPYEGSNATSSNMEGERATASSGLGVRTGPDLRDPDLEHAPGLRYADKDKSQGAGDLEQRFGTARADMAPEHNMDVRREGELFPPERTPERAMASQGWGEQRTLQVVDDDKPIASPDLHPREDDKPR